MRLLIVVVLTLGAQLAFAAGGRDALDAFFSKTQGFSARFSQTVYGDQGSPVQKSDGSMVLRRPGLFRWDYETPFKQVIVGDGAKVWIYDEDLAQVTVRSQQETLGSTPAQLLSTTGALDENFDITEQGQTAGLEWVELTPKDQEAVFGSIRLAFNKAQLTSMELKDNLGHHTVLTFSEVEINPVMDAAVFKLDIPPGVDVVGE